MGMSANVDRCACSLLLRCSGPPAFDWLEHRDPWRDQMLQIIVTALTTGLDYARDIGPTIRFDISASEPVEPATLPEPRGRVSGCTGRIRHDAFERGFPNRDGALKACARQTSAKKLGAGANLASRGARPCYQRGA